jgi:O-methyltransferase
MDIQQFIENFCLRDLTTIDRKYMILKYLWKTKDVNGNVVEMGCNEGHTSVFIQSILNAISEEKDLFLYDSFEGVKGATDRDDRLFFEEGLDNGSFKSSESELRENFKKYKIKPFCIFKGDISNIQQRDLPEAISFAYVDLDVYKPTKNVLGKIWSALSVGGTLMVDDYYLCWCKGVKNAVDEFISENNLTFNIPSHSHQAQDDYWYFREAEKSGWALSLTKE